MKTTRKRTIRVKDEEKEEEEEEEEEEEKAYGQLSLTQSTSLSFPHKQQKQSCLSGVFVAKISKSPDSITATTNI
jgi:hypothetical protein